MLCFRNICTGAGAVALCTGGPRAQAQSPFAGLTSTYDLASDRARVAQLLSPSLSTPADNAPPSGLRILAPASILTWNSQLPSDRASGQLWAGRGANVSVTAGVATALDLNRTTIEVIAAPTVSYSMNTPFQFRPAQVVGRSAFSSPWRTATETADLPSRFGDQSVRRIGPGQSSVTLTTHGLAVGASTRNEWWGPALRNALVLSDNAEGIPRVFVETARPVRTRAGQLAVRLFIGTLTESPFFDANADNDYRSASGLLVTYVPAFDSLLVFGLSRLVIAPITARFAAGHALDAIVNWETPKVSTGTVAQGSGQATDQVASFFARWRFPAAGLETYAEWARMNLPRSVRELLLAPANGSGYTIGAQLARPRARGAVLRAQVELTYLEQTNTFPDFPPVDFYTGRAAAQGFTQRGQLLGAPIGPGGSSQFAAADWLARHWQAGLFASRSRRENDALYRQMNPITTRHDVELAVGVRGGLRRAWGDASGELAIGRRLNYLFENSFNLGQPVIANDVRNVTLSMAFTPR